MTFVVRNGSGYRYRLRDFGKGSWCWGWSLQQSAAHRFPTALAARAVLSSSSDRVVRLRRKPRKGVRS